MNYPNEKLDCIIFSYERNSMLFSDVTMSNTQEVVIIAPSLFQVTA